MAINRASVEYKEKAMKDFTFIQKSASNCIFISYKSQDRKKAEEIGSYIMNYGSIDIYLDIQDSGLLGAISRGDDKNIVYYIERGISRSTHLLCLISDDTKISWWVPYEIGFSKSAGKEIACLKLKDIKDIPSYLKIEKVLKGTKSLNEYLKNINSYSSGFLIPNNKQNHPLDSVIDWKE